MQDQYTKSIVFLNANNEQLEIEIKVPFTIASNYEIEINLPK